MPTRAGPAPSPLRSPVGSRVRSHTLVASVVLGLSLLVGCTARDTAGEGGCNAAVRYDGAVYRQHTGLDQQAPRGPVLGRGEVVGCDPDGPAVAQVTVHQVLGVDPAVAVRTGDGEYAGVYVDRGLPMSAWPAPLRGPSTGP